MPHQLILCKLVMVSRPVDITVTALSVVLFVENFRLSWKLCGGFEGRTQLNT